jgi:3-oxoacyl-(acyl-carrier-protein) synthase
MREPVPISGLGVVSAAGAGAAATLAAFRAGARAPSAVRLGADGPEYPVFRAPGGENTVSTPGGRTLELALRAAGEALASAGLAGAGPLPRAGVCLGTTVACQLNDLEFYRAFRATGRPPLEAVRRYLEGDLATVVARRLGFGGPSLTVVNACSSGADAVGIALEWLRSGACDLALAGGADELNRVPLCGFHALGVMSPAPCAPFDRDRQGLNLGEGAGLLLIETAESARRRGRAPGLFVAGYGAASDAHHLTAPRPDGAGLEAAVRAALEEAGTGPGEVDFVNAHGTATRENDRIEGATLARVFGPRLRAVSSKGFVGHTLGAAGGLEAAFAALALRERWVPASAGFATRDSEIPFEPLREAAAVAGGFAVSTSLAFGGGNAALVLRGGRP